MTTATISKPTAEDFNRFSDEIMGANKKSHITNHLAVHGAPTTTPSLPLLTDNGTIIKDPFEAYLGNTAFYSTGSIAKLAMGCPLDFYYDVNDGVKQELEAYKDRSSLNLGTFSHECVLEPERWETVTCEPMASRASHEGLNTLIEFWEGMVDSYGKMDTTTSKVDAKKEYINSLINKSGKRVVSYKEALVISNMHDRWKNYEGGLWYNILAAANKEVSIYTDNFKGLPMRVRPDGLLTAEQIGVNAIVSVKTTSATTIEQYKRQYLSYGYHLKEAAYQRIVSHVIGQPFETTIQIVLSTVEPFHIGVFILNDNEMAAAYERFEQAMIAARLCIGSGEFPGWELNAEAGCNGLIDLTIS